MRRVVPVFFTGFLFCLCRLHAQDTTKPVSPPGRCTLSGYVKDSTDGENLIAASVYIVELGKGMVTNNYGFYSITVPKGKYTLRVSYVGYISKIIPVALEANKRLNVMLSPFSIQAGEVVVTGERKDENVESTNMGTLEMTVKEAKSLPAFFGEVDILKTLQYLPGIMGGTEGSSGLYVRGGGQDQNLVLLDDAVVYNTGHLFGFFSIFNPDAINSTEIIKGGMPAEYGGRISSVLNITMKNGDLKKWDVEGGIGLIDSRLTIEGPIVRDKCSIIVSARRTYLDLLLKPVLPLIDNGNYVGNDYYFYDINAKINYILSDKDRLYLSGYFGRDVFHYHDPTGIFSIGFPWGNETGTLRWNHLFSDKLFMNTSLVYNDFGFQASTNFEDITANLYSKVRNATAKMDFDYSPLVGHSVKFGWEYTFHVFTPYETSGSAGTTGFSTTDQENKYAHETAVYIQDDFDVTNWLKMNIGVRGSLFNFVGPYSTIQFANGLVTDTLNYKPWQNIKTYGGVEPRLSLRFKVDRASSIKFGSTLNKQYVHQVESSTTTLPFDLWIPSDAIVKPQIGLQNALGYFRNFWNDMIETSVEVYYKYLWNQIEYGENAVPNNITVDEDDLLTFGRGWAYGAEFFIKKAKGKWTGWVSYTLGWSWRKFPEINNDQPFPATYDRRHDLSVVSVYEFNQHWKISGTFVFASGPHTTLPVAAFLNQGQAYFVYGPRNWFELAPYDRLDLGLVYTFVPKKKRKIDFHNDITVSIYNVYSRQNPFFDYVDVTGQLGGTGNSNITGPINFVVKQVSLFPIVPTVTWNFKF